MQQKQTAFDFTDVSELLTKDETEAIAIARDEFERMEAAALRNRSQTVATLSTIASIVAQSATPPFLHIDPHTTGLLAIGHAIDSLRLLDIETSVMTVRELEKRVASDLKRQFTALKADGTISVMPEADDIAAWGKSVVDKLLCRKEHGSQIDSLFDTEINRFYEFPHALLEEYAHGGAIYVRPTAACLTLYLGTLTQGIGDIQTALAAVIQRQIARGEYHAALQTAHEHQRITRQHGEKIRTLRRRILTNAGRYNWNSSVLPEIQLAQRDVEDAIAADTTLEELLDASIDNLPKEKRPLAQRVLLVIKSCRNAYRELQTLAMELPRLYSSCIANQGFVSSHIPLPSMLNDVFNPIFHEVCDPKALLAVCDVVNTQFALPCPPILHDIIAETELLLKPVLATEAKDMSPDSDELLDEDDLALSIFDEMTIAKAKNTIAVMADAGPTQLSDIMKALEPEDFTEECIAAAIMISAAWAHNKSHDGSYTVSRTYNRFACQACTGDDYLIERKGAENDQH
jgi:hypothetical protein